MSIYERKCGLFLPWINEWCNDDKKALIRRWRSERIKLEERCKKPSSAGASWHRTAGTATVLPRDAENVLVQWINDLRRDGIPVSSLMLKLKAKEIAKNFQIEKFAASWSWRKSFWRRHNFSIIKDAPSSNSTRRFRESVSWLWYACTSFDGAIWSSEGLQCWPNR